MQHQAVLQDLSPALRSRLTTRSDRKGLQRLAGHGAVIFLLASVMLTPLWWLSVLPLGIAVVFLFCPLHEVSHDTVFATKRYNTWVARALGLILMIPPQWFRYFHFAHHKHTHDPDHDPELATPKPQTWGGYVWYLSGLPLWWSVVKTLIGNALGKCDAPYVPRRKRAQIRQEAWVMLAVYAGAVLISALLGTTLLLWVWIVPMLLGQPFLRAFLLAEHTLCPHSDNMFENTRTTFTTRLIRWLTWNMSFHAEHHALPMVPFHQLPQLHQHTASHLRQTSDGYTGFHEGYQAGLTGGGPTRRKADSTSSRA